MTSVYQSACLEKTYMFHVKHLVGLSFYAFVVKDIVLVNVKSEV